MNYNYVEEICRDVREYLEDSYSMEELMDMRAGDIVDELFAEDMVVGNGPYGYDYEEVVQKYVCDNFMLALRALHDFDYDVEYLLRYDSSKIFRFIDCLIRLDLLPECVEQVLEEIQGKDKENED